MAASVDDLRAFHDFVARKLAEGGSQPPTPEECLDLWFVENQTPEERADDLAAIQEGLDDMDAGRTRPVDDVLQELRQKYNLPLSQ